MTISIYAAGGTGINIARQIFENNAIINYIDTSNSNIDALKSENVFLVEGMDGAGKHRVDAYEHFKPEVANILVRYKPSAKLNIVIGSLSGGSGSVIAPMLTRELIAGGHNVVAVGVESRQSKIELTNTLKTLQSYRGLSAQLNAPFALYHVDKVSRSEADRDVLGFVSLMSLLTDKSRTSEFDTSDLKSFLYFNRVTDNEPGVSIIRVTPNEAIVPAKNTLLAGSILLTTKREAMLQPVMPDYHATCIVKDPQYPLEDARINAVLGALPIITEELERSIAAMDDAKKINKVRDIRVDGADSSGFVV